MHKVPDVYLQLSLLGMYVCMNVALPRLCPCRDLLDETVSRGRGSMWEFCLAGNQRGAQ